MKSALCLLFVIVAVVGAHKLKSGECPRAEPMAGFEVKKFLGIWYAVQKTATASECIIYNFTNADEPGQYRIEQISQDYLLGLTPLKHKYSYTGELEVKDMDIPAKMTVNFPLSVAGTASFTIFMTDYEQYAGIFTCQKLPVGHRQSATILSRTKDLEPAVLNKIRTRISSFQVDPFDLSIISQSKCPKLDDESGYNIAIDGNTFSAQNIGSWVKSAGTKIGEGVEWTITGGKKIYNKLRPSDESGERSSRLTQSETERPVWMP